MSRRSSDVLRAATKYSTAMKKYAAAAKAQNGTTSTPLHLESSDVAEPSKQPPDAIEASRDDVECGARALPELLTLERYERRALSRRRRAIRRFVALAD
jgi:hypothetical protein